MARKFAEPEVDPALTAEASLKQARDTLHNLIKSLELDKPDPASIHPLGPISISSARVSILKSLRNIRNAHQSTGNYDLDTERVSRLKHDATLGIQRTTKAMQNLAKVVEMGRIGDVFAGSSEKRRGILKVAAERSGAQCIEDSVGEAGSLTVCGDTFLADFRFGGDDVQVDFRHLVSSGNDGGGSGLGEQRFADVDRDFEELVREQKLEDLCEAFRGLLGLEKLATSLGAAPQVLKMPLQCFENDVLAAFGITSFIHDVRRAARGLTLLYHKPCFPFSPVLKENAGENVSKKKVDKYVARLDIEPTSKKQKFLIGSTRPELGPEEEEELDVRLPAKRKMIRKVVYSSARAADIAATFVLVLDPPVLVSHSTAVALYALSDSLPIAESTAQVSLSARTSASTATPPNLVLAVGGSRSRRALSNLLLCPEKSIRKKKTIYLQSATPQGPVKMSIGVHEEEAGMRVSRVPISHPRDVERVIGLLKQQLVYNEILRSCLGGKVIDEKDASDTIPDAMLTHPVEVVVRYAPSFIQFTVGKGDDILSVGIVIKVGGELTVSTKLIDVEGHSGSGTKSMACSDAMLTEMFSKTRHAPMILAKMWAMGKR